MKSIILIPARGGSRGVPRKNVRLLNHKPLLQYVLETVNSISDQVTTYVMTDDDEIEYLAKKFNAVVVREPQTSGKATLDDVTRAFLETLKDKPSPDTILFTVQPTCPFIKAETILKAIEKIKANEGSIITVTDDRHLAWTVEADGTPRKLYKDRVNRQMLPPTFRESGAVIGTRLKNFYQHKTRIVEPIQLLEITKEEGIDIDDFSDWAVAEHIAKRKKIIIRTDAHAMMGMGHLYRSLAVAQEIAQHDVIIYTDNNFPLGNEFFSKVPFRSVNEDGEKFTSFVAAEKPDLVILDVLDTGKDFVRSLKQHARKVITFEDFGEGSTLTDLVINDLYHNTNVEDQRQISGYENSILAPGFDILEGKKEASKKINNILVLFGGTDPSNLTEKTLSALQLSDYQGSVTVIQGLGRKDRKLRLEDFKLKGEFLTNVQYIPQYMLGSDLAISSAGRTISELISLAIPTLCLCQNKKEIMHTHASQQYGIINLGLGALVEPVTIAKHIQLLSEDADLRQGMINRQLWHGSKRKNQKIVEKILALLN